MSAKRIAYLKRELARVRARLDEIRAVPGGRKACADYGDLIGLSVRLGEELMVLQDPAVAAYLRR